MPKSPFDDIKELPTLKKRADAAAEVYNGLDVQERRKPAILAQIIKALGLSSSFTGEPDANLVQEIKSFPTDPGENPYGGFVIAQIPGVIVIKAFQWKAGDKCLPHNHGNGPDPENDTRGIIYVADGDFMHTLWKFKQDGTPYADRTVRTEPGKILYAQRHVFHQLGGMPVDGEGPKQNTWTLHIYTPPIEHMHVIVPKGEENRCEVCRLCSGQPAWLPKKDPLTVINPFDPGFTPERIIEMAMAATQRKEYVEGFRQAMNSGILRVGENIERKFPIL